MTGSISVHGLGKKYEIGLAGPAYGRLTESLSAALRAPRRTFKARREAAQRAVIWAIRDVSFEIEAGEVVGLIGPNGAGKTTILKILSRITDPTEGFAELRGRVRSLLEVGTGFHPELTGRENIFLNGAILGMSRSEVTQKFEEIVSFSGVEKFIDSPIKWYSSGMHVRLAFSVAAHLDPEILILDEVLAVGDTAFQKKCLGKIHDVARGGRTVLFVSHNMTAVRSLCTKGMLIEEGKLRFAGPTDECVDLYLRRVQQKGLAAVATRDIPRPDGISADSGLRISSVHVFSQEGSDVIPTGAAFRVRMEFECDRPLTDVVWGFSIYSVEGWVLMAPRSGRLPAAARVLERGIYSITARLEANPLAPGHYSLGVGARNRDGGLDWIPHVIDFDVVETTKYESVWLEQPEGMFRVETSWDAPQVKETGPLN